MDKVNEAYWRGYHNGYACAMEDNAKLTIVRCKDCKHYNEHPSGFGCCEIHKGSIAIQTPFTFCAWGERREDADS